jgi:15-cis-phytoene synthase
MNALVCTQTLAAHGKSFALASRWLDPGRRHDAAALYTWCRRADDAIDLPSARSPQQAIAALRSELADVYAGRVQADPATAAFQRTVFERGIPLEYPSALIDGLEQDANGARYDDLPALLGYCYRVASTVGLMMSHVLGVSDPRALVNAAHLGIAMQLTNISRDVHEDWQRGRLYLPRELLHELGAEELTQQVGEPLWQGARRALAQATGRVLSEADVWYASGDRGLSALSFRAALAIRCARRIYARIGHHVRRRGADPLAGRAVVPGGEKLLLAAASLGHALLELPARVLWPHQPVPIRQIVRFPDDVLCI